MSAQQTTDDNFKKDVLESDLPVLVDFWASWCGPCKQLAPVLDSIAEEFSGKVKVVKVNIDEHPNTPTEYGVRGIPNLILFKDGEAVDSKVGAIPQSALKEWLNSQTA